MRPFQLIFAALLASNCSAPQDGQSAADDAPPLPQAESADGPFGLAMGLSQADLQRLVGPLKHLGEGVYSSSSVPKPHPSFESYTFVVSPNDGLCKLSAIGKDIGINSFGTQVREEFDRIESGVASKYGAGLRYDFLKAGSIWDDPNDWSMALYLEEYNLATFWADSSDALRSESLSAINLEARSTQNGVGWVRLSYEFENAAPCLASIAEAKNKVF